MIKTIVLTDFSNLTGQLAKINRKPDMPKLRDNVLANDSEGRFLQDFYIYASLPHENGEGRQRFYTWLRSQGFQVISKRAKKLPDGRLKCNLDGEMMLDAIELARDIRPDVMVLVTGDGDFAELCTRLRRIGVRAEVASINNGLANELRCAANGVIDLSEWANECDPLNPNEAVLPIGNANIFEQAI